MYLVETLEAKISLSLIFRGLFGLMTVCYLFAGSCDPLGPNKPYIFGILAVRYREIQSEGKQRRKNKEHENEMEKKITRTRKDKTTMRIKRRR